MPQIWLTYDELSVLLDCDGPAARASAISMALDRRKSRDGQTRCKLSPRLAEAFLDDVIADRLDRQSIANAAELRTIHERLAARLTTEGAKKAVNG